MNTNDDFQVLKVKDIMERLGIGKDRAYALMKSKSFPATQLGKTYFVTTVKFEEWLEANAGKNVNL